MNARPEDRGSLLPPGPQDVQSAYGNPQRRPGRPRQSIMETVIKSMIRSVAGSLGRAIMRAIVGRR